MNEMILQSIDIEIGEIFESCNRDFEMAKAQLDEHILGFSFMEASEENGGGLFGFLKTIFKSILKMLDSLKEKMKSFLFGKKVNPEDENKEVEISKNPKLIVQLCNEDIKDSKTMLDRCMKGEISVEEAKQFIDKKVSARGAIGPIVATVTSVFGACTLNEKFLSKWKKEADEVYNELQASGQNRFAEKYANQYKSSNKEAVAKEGAELICEHIKDTIEYGFLNGVINPIKTLYQKNYISNRISAEGDSFSDNKKYKAFRKNRDKERAMIDKQRSKLIKGARNRDRNATDYELSANELQQSKNRMNKSIRKNFSDMKNK